VRLGCSNQPVVEGKALRGLLARVLGLAGPDRAYELTLEEAPARGDAPVGSALEEARLGQAAHEGEHRAGLRKADDRRDGHHRRDGAVALVVRAELGKVLLVAGGGNHGAVE